MTRNGTPAAALVPIDEYEALEETAEILSDPDALAALEAGLAEDAWAYWSGSREPATRSAANFMGCTR